MIGFYLLAAHMAGDYLFQSSWMAANKLTNAVARAVHVLVYSACFVPVVLTSGAAAWRMEAFVFLLAASHFLTDSKRWRTSNPWPAMPILQDQSLHAAQIALLAGLFLS